MAEMNTIVATPGEHPFKFGSPVTEVFNDSQRYDADEDLTAAIRVALLLGMPLLLTGEPGSGKTSVADWLAWKLQLGAPLVYNVKSTTTGRDLLYQFDELARFRDSQAGERRAVESYVRLNALGLAILYSGDAGAPVRIDPLPLTRATLAETGRLGTAEGSQFGRRHVVLIDELDKAPRDTPNDLLLEIAEMRFHIDELGIGIPGQKENRPVVIITSNSEKSLPEPFLRRCVFHHIKSPDDRRRRRIIARRQHPFASRAELFEQAMRLYDVLHGTLSRPPGTAELLAWLTVLDDAVEAAQARRPAREAPPSLKGLVKNSLGTLAKTKEDIDRATAAVVSEGLD